MELPRHIWQWVLAFGVEVQTFVAEFAERTWNTVPGSDTAGKLVVLGSVLGGLTALPVFHWLWQKWRHTDIDFKVSKMEEHMQQLHVAIKGRATITASVCSANRKFGVQDRTPAQEVRKKRLFCCSGVT